LNTGLGLYYYGLGLTIRGRPEEGLGPIQRSVAVYRRAGLTGDRTFAGLLDGQALCEVELGHYANAERVLEESTAIDERNGGLFAGLAYQSFVPRTNLLIADGRAEEAVRMLDGFASRSGSSGEMSSTRMPFALARADTELVLGHYARAIEAAATVRGVVGHSSSRTHLKRYESVAALTEGKALVGSGQPVQALPLLERAAYLASETYEPETSLALADAQVALADCQARMGNLAEAQRLMANVRSIHSRHSSVRAPSVRALHELEARLRGAS